jgi:hypothetical protein
MAASQASLRIRNGMRSRTALEGSRRLVATPTLPELTARQYWGTYVRIRCSSDMARDRSREELRPGVDGCAACTVGCSVCMLCASFATCRLLALLHACRGSGSSIARLLPSARCPAVSCSHGPSSSPLQDRPPEGRARFSYQEILQNFSDFSSHRICDTCMKH